MQQHTNACESKCETPFEVYVKICVNLHVSTMWNSFAIQWGVTCESLCDTPCEVYVKICVKGLTSFHTHLTYISLSKISHACEICVWNSCEKCVKNVWKECENWTIFTCFFHMMFHIHSPSSVVQGDNGMLPILSSSSKRNRRKLKPGSAKQFRMIVQRWRTRKSPFKVKLPPFCMMQTNF